MAKLFSRKRAVLADAVTVLLIDIAEKASARDHTGFRQSGIVILAPSPSILIIQGADQFRLIPLVLKGSGIWLQHFDTTFDILQRWGVGGKVTHDEFVRAPQKLHILVLGKGTVLAYASVGVL